jgi:hypothetical protein
MALIDNLVSYWKLDEASGTREDAHSTNDLTDNNTVGNINPGIIVLGADFISANSEYLSITDAAQTGLEPASLTVSMWVKTKADLLNAEILAKAYTTAHSPPYYSYLVGLGNDAGAPRFDAAFGGVISGLYGTTTVTAAMGWVHLVATYDGTTARIYFNGDEENSAAKSAISYSDGPFVIGKTGSAAAYYNGYADEVGIWSRAITADEVVSLYNGGAGLAYPFSSGSAARNLSLLGVGT